MVVSGCIFNAVKNLHATYIIGMGFGSLSSQTRRVRWDKELWLSIRLIVIKRRRRNVSILQMRCWAWFTYHPP